MSNKPSIRRKAAVRDNGGLHFHFSFGRAAFFLLLLSVGFGAGGCMRRPAEPVLEEYGSGQQDASEEADRSENPDGEEKADSKEETEQEGAIDRGIEAGQEADPSDRDTGKEDLSGVQKEPGAAGASAASVTVHVCGAVKKEGVYRLPEGSRVEDAVRAAGGFTQEADTTWLNLARRLEDAEQILVPSREEAELLRKEQARDPSSGGGSGSLAERGTDRAGEEAPAQGSGSAEGKININTASREELMKIPGIGEAKAQRILDYRETNGGFETIEDLMKVPGIKKASFEKMRAYITL